MVRWLALPVIGGLLLAAAPAHAQYKLSEVMAGGGSIMTAGEIRRELVGARISGINEFGGNVEIELKTDGTLDGIVYTRRGPIGISGTWTLNGKNQLCTELSFTARTAAGTRTSRCVWYWKAASEYFSTDSQKDADAAAALVECLIAEGSGCKRDLVLGKRTVGR